METLISTMVSLTEVQNEQATTLRNFAKIIAEVHQFTVQCSPHNVALMKDMNAFQATIASLTACIAALETAPSPPPLPPQDTTTGPSDQVLGLAARIDALEAAPPPPPPPPPPSLSLTPSFTTITKLQRQLVVTCDPTPPTTITNDAILASVNKELGTSGVRFIYARRSLKGNLVLQTAPAKTASEAIEQAELIAANLRDLECTPTLMFSKAVWTSFLVHNVPTSSTLKKQPQPSS
ncbi:hypothetical protein Q9L58_009797 [Maublancomyces gigas]|uniref:Uncharacterized protein n=1 Tax=Discina gigas TaxID=1032678 RepID=A0ABR3G5W4_9PEZI